MTTAPRPGDGGLVTDGLVVTLFGVIEPVALGLFVLDDEPPTPPKEVVREGPQTEPFPTDPPCR